MLHDVIRGGHARSVISLNSIFPRQRIVRELCQHPARIADRPVQLGNERLPRKGAALRKFAVAFPLVFRSAQPGNNPLADISAKMQDKIAGAVGRGIGAPPNFVFGKLLKAFDDVGKIVFRDQLLRFRKKQACGTACFGFHGGHLA